jgi:predicted HAD superfamily hydrolase
MIPYDVKLIIYRFLHELKMNDVLKELIDQYNYIEKVMNYLENKTFYPYSIAKRFINSNNSIFYKNKIQKNISLKLFSKCIKNLNYLNYVFPISELHI